MKRVTLVAVLAACGDNTSPPETYQYAEDQWADAWCAYAYRCAPEMFDAIYHTPEMCRAKVAARNCARTNRTHACTDWFPDEQLDEVQECHDLLHDINCSATGAPDVCKDAFR
jgi:hypothetical protein